MAARPALVKLRTLPSLKATWPTPRCNDRVQADDRTGRQRYQASGDWHAVGGHVPMILPSIILLVLSWKRAPRNGKIIDGRIMGAEAEEPIFVLKIIL